MHPAEASHGDLGMIAANDVVFALSWSGETAELKNLIDYSRRFRIGLIAVTAEADCDAGQRRRRRPGAAAGARGLPAQSRADHLVADAARARRRAGDRAAGKPRLHRASISACCIRAASSARCSSFVRDFMHGGEAMPLAASAPACPTRSS